MSSETAEGDANRAPAADENPAKEAAAPEAPPKEETQPAQEAARPDSLPDSKGKAGPAGRGWYVVHTQPGYEDRVKRSLEQKISVENLSGKVFQVFVPTEDVVEIKKNKKQVKKRKFFPAYLLMDMVVDNETYWFVKNVTGVTGFLGEPRPTPLPQEEINAILELTTASAASKPRPAVQFERGENVRITDGPFRHFIGVVEEVNEPKSKLKAMVTIFGRPTPVELDFLQVEKL